MLRLLCTVIGVGALLLASSGQCKDSDIKEEIKKNVDPIGRYVNGVLSGAIKGRSYTAEEVQEKLRTALGLIKPAHRAIVEEFMKFVDAEPRGQANKSDFDLYWRAVQAYRDSKGQKATETLAKRTNIIDSLQFACQDAQKHLLDFELTVKLVKKDQGAQVLHGLTEVDRWAAAYEACKTVSYDLCGKYSRYYNYLRQVNIMDPIPDEVLNAAPKKKSFLGFVSRNKST